MKVGVNYPWFDYGWDFGVAPPSWRGSSTSPRWFANIDQDLQHLRNLGISVVRWFVLADGLTYGTGQYAPRPDPALKGQWRFDPPALSADFLLHYEELLRRFENANKDTKPPIQLIPVLIDFHFCEPGIRPIQQPNPANPRRTVSNPDWVKQGRGDAIKDAGKRRRFLDNVFDPLLRASKAHHDVIYAWELINEPDWITNGWHRDRQSNHPVDEVSMRAFLDEGKSRIRSSGFKPTIGFASIDTLRRSGVTAEINQFHHYPGGVHSLERHTFNPQYPGIVGEFATAATDTWPELVKTGQTVLNRLRLAEAQGYPLVIPWSFRASDIHTSWSLSVENDIQCFTQKRNCPQSTSPQVS